MTIDHVRSKLNNHIGDVVMIKYNLGRNKYEKYHATIKELYSNVFTVEIEKNHIVKSFSYSDLITKTVKIEYW